MRARLSVTWMASDVQARSHAPHAMQLAWQALRATAPASRLEQSSKMR